MQRVAQAFNFIRHEGNDGDRAGADGVPLWRREETLPSR